MENLQSEVLSRCKNRWQKIAMVIATTAMERGESMRTAMILGPLGTNDPDPVYDKYLAAVHSLIDSGQLEIQGDPALPRYSEVRHAR